MDEMPDELVARLRSAGCVFAEEEAAELRAAAASAGELEAMALRRVAGEPLEQVVGAAWFDGLRIRLLPGVFVPRLRTTAMVRLAADRLTGRGSLAELGLSQGPTTGAVMLDIGCGSGAIGAAVAARVPGVEVWAVDVDPVAVDCARLNLPPERVLLGDLFTPLPADLRASVVCANAPYVPTAAIGSMPPEARDHEHRVALDGGTDGLDVQRRLIAQAPRWLVEGGSLLVEASSAQAPATAALMRQVGLSTRIHRDDDVEGTVVEGRKAVHPPPVDDLSHR